MRLYPEQIIAYDVANAQQSHGQLYRATLAHMVIELQSAQCTQAGRMDSMAQKVDELGALQGEVLAAVQQGAQAVQRLQVVQPPPPARPPQPHAGQEAEKPPAEQPSQPSQQPHPLPAAVSAWSRRPPPYHVEVPSRTRLAPIQVPQGRLIPQPR